MNSNQARQELAAFLEENGLTQRQLARALGVSDPVVHDWLSGDRRPRDVHRRGIAAFTRGRIPFDAWLSDEERAEIERVGALAPAPQTGTGTEG
jgi:transcriptional regulator with XRE-family HTH domain